MAREVIKKRGEEGFIPKDYKSNEYLLVSDISAGDQISSRFNAEIVNARQEIYFLFYEGSGVSLVNRDTGTSSYKLSISKTQSTNPFDYPLTNNVVFDLTRDGSSLFNFPKTIDVGPHQWLGIRLTTIDSVVKDKIFIKVEWKTDRYWNILDISYDDNPDLWGTYGSFGWDIDSSLSSFVGLDDWKVQSYNVGGEDLPDPILRDKVFLVSENRFEDLYNGIPITLPIVDSFEFSDYRKEDFESPSVSIITNPPPSQDINLPVLFEWEGSDSSTGDLEIIGYEYQLNDSRFVFTENTSITIPPERLKLGVNVFRVRAIDENNNSTHPLAEYSWTATSSIDLPPDTTILTGPSEGDYTFKTSATFTFTGTDDNSIDHFEYRVDGGGWIPLPPLVNTATVSGLSLGSHSFEVRAVDSLGQVDPTPAIRNWIVYDFAQIPNLVHWVDFTDPTLVNGGSSTQVFSFPTPMLEWNINHNLGEFPSVTTVDLSGNEVIGNITYIDDNNVKVTFLSPNSGYAYLNGGTTIYNQLTPSSLWVINHGLNKFPHVTTVDVSGNQIFGNVRYISSNTIEISFNTAEVGRVYLNGDSTFSFTQPLASSTWTISHNLNEYPAVTTVDTSGNQIFGNVRYLDSNTIEVTFNSPESGNAYLNSSSTTDGSSIISIIEKSPLNRTFVLKSGASTPEFSLDILSTPSDPIAGAIFSSGDILEDTVSNSFISGNELTFCFVAARDGSSGSLLSVFGAGSDLILGRDSGVTSTSQFFARSGTNSVTASPEEPLGIDNEVAFVMFRTSSGRGELFINGAKIVESDLDFSWNLGSAANSIELGSNDLNAKVLHTVIYNRKLNDSEVSVIADTYDPIFSPLGQDFLETFSDNTTVDISTRASDTGQSWVSLSGSIETSGSGNAVVSSSPAFYYTDTNIASNNYMVIFEGIGSLPDSDEISFVFGADPLSPNQNYYRVKIDNLQSGSGLIRLQKISSGTLQPDIATLPIPWQQTIGLDGSINVLIGVRGSNIDFGAGINSTPSTQSDYITPWSGDRSSNFISTTSTLYGKVIGFDFGSSASGISIDSVRVVSK